MQRDERKTSKLRRTLILLLLALAVCIPGCKGCSCRSTPNRAKTPEELEKELEERQARLQEQEKKKPLRELRYTSLPHGPMGGFPKLGEGPQSACFVKPGHWTATTFSAIANNFDIIGNLELAAGKATPLPGMPFAMTARRSVALPKGQVKTFDTVFYLPESRSPPPMLGQLDARRKSGGYYSLFPGVRRMPFYQYHFVVLARYPEWYGYLRTLDCVRGPMDMQIQEAQKSDGYYRVSMLAPGRRTPLPDRALLWTSTAYLLWDDADPDALSLDQQVAILDWIHWGGQLIISGPETLDTLQNSFLADYLPALSGGSFDLAAGDLEEINRHWTLPIRRMPGQELTPNSKWSGVKLKKHPAAQDVPTTGGLLVERRIGRGRVVVSAFKLGGREFTSWPARDGFFNGCLMRHPPRRFGGDWNLKEYFVTWADDGSGSGSVASQYNTERLCQLRFFSRDTGRADTELVLTSNPFLEGENPEEQDDQSGWAAMVETETLNVPGKNFGAWNDFSAVANAARAALADAAGIEVPDRSFVVWIVAGYLVVLVPLNWLLFKLLGRVEWAWIAAPVIAVICAVVVVRQAQLDIGFVRSENEVAIVELQADYPRGHVTRYTAFYTSLGTGYDFEFDDFGTQILPFPSTGDPNSTGLKFGESPQRVTYRYGSQVHLDDLRVRSSSAQMTHCEQMLDLGGGLEWLEPAPGVNRVVNRTGYPLRDAGVVRMTAEGRVLTAWLGTIDSEQSADVDNRWQPAAIDEAGGGLWAERRNRVPQTSRGTEADALTLQPLLRLAEKTDDMQPGDVRLIAWTDETLPGMKVRPVAPQKRRLALVLAHLQYGFGNDPVPDKNSRWDFVRRPKVFRDEASTAPEEEEEESTDEKASSEETEIPDA